MQSIKKIIHFDDIKKKLLKKINDKKIVLCHGVFDLLHVGHLNHFEESKTFGDLLIVSITEDFYVKKGPNRPVFKTLQRAKIISALKCVDYVIINNNYTSENVIKILKPSVYAKGIDYLDSSKDYTNNIKNEINAIKSVKGKIKITKSEKIDSSQVLNNFDLIFSNYQKNFLRKVKNILNLVKIEDYFKKIKKLKVLVIGELIIDHYVLCETLGKSGKEAFLTFKKKKEIKFLGGSGFIANQVSNFVDNVDIVSVLGDSRNEKKFITKKLNKNVKLKSFLKKNSPTIVKSRFVDDIDYKKIIGIYDLNDEKIDKNLEAKLNKYIKENKNKYDVIIVSDFGHGMITHKLARQICLTKKFLSINAQVNSSNTGERNLRKYNNADCIFINSSELAHEAGRKGDINYLAKDLKKTTNTKNLIVTRGSSGSLLINEKNKLIESPAFAKNKKDKIGAGDALMGIFSIFKAKNFDDSVSLFISSLVSGYTVEQFGNDKPIDLNQIKKILSHIII